MIPPYIVCAARALQWECAFVCVCGEEREKEYTRVRQCHAQNFDGRKVVVVCDRRLNRNHEIVVWMHGMCVMVHCCVEVHDIVNALRENSIRSLFFHFYSFVFLPFIKFQGCSPPFLFFYFFLITRNCYFSVGDFYFAATHDVVIDCEYKITFADVFTAAFTHFHTLALSLSLSSELITFIASSAECFSSFRKVRWTRPRTWFTFEWFESIKKNLT